MLRGIRHHIALLVATPYLAAGCCSGSPPPADLEGMWELRRSASPPEEGCTPLPAATLDMAIFGACGGGETVSIDQALEVRDVGVGERTVGFTSSELPFSDSRGLLLVHALELDRNGQLRGTASGSGDGDDLGCRYQVTVVGTKIN
jgi:hypothetical protein